MTHTGNTHRSGYWLLLALCMLAAAMLAVLVLPRWPDQTGLWRSALAVAVVAGLLIGAKLMRHVRRDASLQSDELRTRQVQLRSILNAMSTAVLAIDREHTVLGLNPAAMELLDSTEPTPSGESLHAMQLDQGLLDFVEGAFATGGFRTGEVVLHGKVDRSVIVRSEPVHGLAGGIDGIVLVFDDVTRLRRLETMRSDFAANVSHELRTPITAIQGYAELLDSASEAERSDFAQVILRNTQRLSAIIEDLLALSRLEEDQQAGLADHDAVPMHELLAAVARACSQEAARESVLLELECPEHLECQGSRALLEQAVTNLVTNAIRYGGSGTTVELGAERSDANLISISVVDHGPGIPAEHHGRVFERFYRVDRGRSRQVGGTGLGLAIVKHIALAHQGGVRLTETPGGGCTFALTVPNTA